MATGVYAVEIPDSTVQSATAASYTIPTNYYAKVKAAVGGTGTLSINGVQVMAGSTWTALASSTLKVTATGGTGGVANPDYNAGGGSMGASGLVTSPSIANDGSNYAADQGLLAAFAGDTAKTKITQTFVLKAGEVVVGSGDAAYHIELYKMPGT